MRGTDGRIGTLFGYVDLQERVPVRHPLLAIRKIAKEALAVRDSVCEGGRPSIPPEKQLRALLLQAFYSVRCER